MSKLPPVIICMRSFLVRAGLAQVLTEHGYAIKASLTSIDEVIRRKNKPCNAFIIVDGQLSQRDGEIDEKVIQNIRASYPASSIVILSERFDFKIRWQAGRLGLSGVLLQSISIENFLTSLKLITMGGHVFSAPDPDTLCENSPEMTKPAEDAVPAALELPNQSEQTVIFQSGASDLPLSDKSQARIARRAELSEREREVLNCLVVGHSNKMIARMCSITEATVKVHLKSILRKTDVSNRTQAAIWAMNNMNAVSTKIMTHERENA